MHRRFVLALAMLGASHAAAAQTPGPYPAAVSLPDDTDSRWVTVRLHVGPNLNVMRDWRDGLGTLQTRAQQRGLPITDESCICMSWGSTALVHVTARVGIGVQFEMLRDTRSFSVDDHLGFFGVDRIVSFGFTNETVVRTTQVVAALYPRQGSRTHVQAGVGRGSGHSRFSTPGADAEGRGSGMLVSASAGMESSFWYTDAGWRLHRMRVSYDTIRDQTIDEARDLFTSEAAVRDFLQERNADFTGGWVRIGLVFRFGRR